MNPPIWKMKNTVLFARWMSLSDAPQTQHPGQSDQQGSPGIPADSRQREQIPDAPQLLGGIRRCLGPRFLPLFRLANEKADDHDQQRRSDAHHIHPPPAHFRQHKGDDGSHHIPHRGQGLKEAQRHRTRTGWPHLRHQRGPGRELAPDAERGEKPAESILQRSVHQGIQTGEQRIDQDGDHHGARPADLVAQDTEKQPSQGPAHQEDGGQLVTPSLHGLVQRGAGIVSAQDVLQRPEADKGEKLLVQRVEQPTEGRNDKDQPGVA